MYKRIACLFAACLCSLQVGAYETGRKHLGHLETYKPNYIAYRKDSGDVAFMDFQLSLKYPILHDNTPEPPNYGWLPAPYLAFTVRSGQYIETRDSAPVIAKSYNPELFFRYWINSETKPKGSVDSIDIIYGHESNGQSINTELSYQQKQTDLTNRGEDIGFSDDYISRGWDYASFRWTHNWDQELSDKSQFTTYITFKKFLANGLLQGDIEEYNHWENDAEGKPRSETDGISLMFRLNTEFEGDVISGDKILISYVTGLEDSFTNNTFKMEFALDVGNLPLMVWLSHGYNSSVARYYREVTSVGIGLEFLGI